MTHHDIELYNPLIVNSTQGILNTIEYLLFYIKFFQKRHNERALRKKGHTVSKLWGEGGGAEAPSAPEGFHIPCKHSLDCNKTSFSVLFVIISTPLKFSDITSTKKSLKSFCLSLKNGCSHQVINSLLLRMP